MTKIIILFSCLLMAGAVTACGSSSSTSSASSSAAAGTGSANRTKLVACLKAHGVTLPGRPAGARRRFTPGAGGYGGGFFGGSPGGAPGGGAGGGRLRSDPKFAAALKACGTTFGARRFNPAARRTAIETFVTCVRRHGYTLPAPNFSGKGSVFPTKIQSNPRFRTASQACASTLRSPGSGPGSGRGAGTGTSPSA